jgi:hypothetical protein
MTERSTNAWLSIGGYARTYGISRNTVKKWLGAQLLETYQFDGLVRIRNCPPNAQQPPTLAVSVQSRLSH